jgi:hypothetical protein
VAAGLSLGDRVYVNASRLDQAVDCPGAFYETNVVQKQSRSVRVNLPGGNISDWIATKYVHQKAGIAIVQLGDFLNEATNLDPLSKGIMQNARILYGDDASVRYWKIRSESELAFLFDAGMLNFADKVILIAHGSDEGQLSIGASTIVASRLGEIVAGANNPPAAGWEFICAICHSGKAALGKVLSRYRNIGFVIGPMHQSHSSEMAQFIQTYLNFHLLAGFTATVAAKYARQSATGEATFRMWKNGQRQSLTYD